MTAAKLKHTEHPLFPYDVEDDIPEEGDEGVHEIKHIVVTRFDPVQSKFLWAIDSHPAEDVMSLADLYELYGGGKYELYAKTDVQGRPGHTIRRLRYDIPGISKPLSPSDTPGATPAPTPSASTAAGVHDVAGATGMEKILLLLMTQQAESNKMFMQMMANQTQVMVAALGNRGGDANAAALGQIAAAAISRPPPPAPAEAPADTIFKAMRMGAEMAGVQEVDDGPDGEDENVASTILEGVRAFKEMTGGASSGSHPHPQGNGNAPTPPARPVQNPPG